MFPLKDSTGSNGKYVFPRVGQSVTVKLLEHLGVREKMGKFARNEKGELSYEEAFRCTHEGAEKELRGPWRMRAAIKEALKDCDDAEPLVKIDCAYKMETFKNGRRGEVKAYTIAIQVPF